MRDNIIFIVGIVAILGIIAYMNGNDIDDCIARGHSEATCQRTFNR